VYIVYNVSVLAQRCPYFRGCCRQYITKQLNTTSVQLNQMTTCKNSKMQICSMLFIILYRETDQLLFGLFTL